MPPGQVGARPGLRVFFKVRGPEASKPREQTILASLPEVVLRGPGERMTERMRREINVGHDGLPTSSGASSPMDAAWFNHRGLMTRGQGMRWEGELPGGGRAAWMGHCIPDLGLHGVGAWTLQEEPGWPRPQRPHEP